MRFRSRSYLTYPAIICTALIAALVLSEGCSGGGGHLPSNSTPTPSTPTPTATPTATPNQSPVIVQASINWGTRTRVTTPTTTGPVIGLSSALSAKITLSDPTTGDPVLSWNAERPAGNLGGDVSYPSPSSVTPGVYKLTVTFYSQTGETGSVVGVAQASATVQPVSGVLSYTIATTGTIASVVVDGVSVNNATTTNLHVGATADLVYSLRDSKNNLLAQSVTGTASGTASNVTVSDTNKATAVNGDQLKGIAPGTVTVSVTVDGVTSAPTTISIKSDAAVTAVTPASGAATVTRAATANFAVSVANDPTNSGVTWTLITPATGNPDNTAGPGTITPNADGVSAVYTAPTTTDASKTYTYILRATSNYDSTAFTDFTITVVSLVQVTVKDAASGVVAPPGATQASPDAVPVNNSVQFVATVLNAPVGQTGVTWQVLKADGTVGDSTTYGSITAGGLYTAPGAEVSTAFIIRATSKADPSKSVDFYIVVQSGSLSVGIN